MRIGKKKKYLADAAFDIILVLIATLGCIV
jgi:hypothetical protein